MFLVLLFFFKSGNIRQPMAFSDEVSSAIFYSGWVTFGLRMICASRIQIDYVLCNQIHATY